MFQGKLFSIKHINNIAVYIIAASGKEAITPVKIYIQAFASLKCRKDRKSEGDNRSKNIKFTPF